MPRPARVAPPPAVIADPVGRLADWFAAAGRVPADFQRETWAAYLAGQSGLIHAPTGTGKTLAAWLGPVAEFLVERPDPAGWHPKQPAPLRVVWVTPLRALAADTLANLSAPAAAIGLPWTVQTRTGDTAASVRAKQTKQFPTCLITTPESLTLLLTRADTRDRMADLRCVVVDEWHELVGGKRGVQVELALARLRAWRPGLRTWGLSATLGNLPQALAVLLGPGGAGRLVRGAGDKVVRIDSVIPAAVERFPWAGHLGLRLVPAAAAEIESAATSLVFTNTRAQAELWYQALLARRPDWAGRIAVHHGSLGKKVRDFVEDGLRAGSLKCVVCTSSLDLGVDFAPVERVLQVGSPKGVGRLVQRAGRSGHRPGAESRVTCVPTNALELVEIAAARDAADAGRIEGRPPLVGPLDVLAQHLVTVAVGTGFDPADLLAEVRSTHAYAGLTAAEFGWALDFVVRGGDSLRAYPDYHRVTLAADGLYRVESAAVVTRHRMSVGTIVGEGSVTVRFVRGGILGTVEESFAGRLKPGDVFQFAGRTVQLVRVHEMTAFVKKSAAKSGVVPRWAGSRLPLSAELAAAVRAKIAAARDGVYAGPEMRAVEPILELQRRWSALPGAGEVLVERLRTREGWHVFVYPFEGRSVHEGLAAVCAVRLGRRVPITFTLAVNDYGFELLSPTEPPWDAAVAGGLFDPAGLADDILAGLNAAEMGRRAFREVARVAGLVFPGMPGRGKTAKQLQASSNLFYQVFREYDPDNLLLKQAEREVLDRQLDEARMAAALVRINAAGLLETRPHRPTPLAFPLLVDRLRESVSSEKLADRVRRMQLDLEREADR